MSLLEDVRFGLRMTAKNPGFTLTIVGALALGIGVNAAVFAIGNASLKASPSGGDRILYLGRDVSYPDLLDWRAQSKTFQGLGAFISQPINVKDNAGAPSRQNLAQITANTFSLIGKQPMLGRDFTADDEKAGAAPVTILSYTLWENRFSSNPDVIGQIVKVNNQPATVIGVMPRDVRFPLISDLWEPLLHGERRTLNAFGFLAPGATQKSATAEMQAITRHLETPVVAHTFNQEYGPRDAPMQFAALMGAVSFVLLIACANAANLLLARAVDRSREISIRIALGSSRWRIVRQLLVESVMLSMAAGVAGWLIASEGLRVFENAVRSQIPPWMHLDLDYRGFSYLAAISILTGLLFGLAPALKLSKLDVNGALKDGGWGSSGALRGKFLSGSLVVVEMALALVLLAGAGLAIRSFLNVYTVKTGVNAKNVLTLPIDLSDTKYPQPEDRLAYYQRLKARIDAMPGVDAADFASDVPTEGSMSSPFDLEGAPTATPPKELSFLAVGPDYFRALDVPIQRGRAFTAADTLTAIVNQRFASKSWPGEDALGKRLRLFDGKTPGDWLTVVGIVPDILQDGATSKHFAPLIYLPYRHAPPSSTWLLLRTRVPPATLVNALRQEVQRADEDMPINGVRTLEERLARNYFLQQTLGGLFAIFALIALVLASVGLNAVIAHAVSQRTQEIGVRMALGASARDILRLILSEGLMQLAIGLAAGLAAAVALTRVLNSILVGVSATDPLTLAMVCVVLIASALLGCAIPALRAMRVDPAVALRHE